MLVVSIIMLNDSGFYIKGTSYLGGGTDNLSTKFTCLIFLQALVPNWQSPNCINVIWMSCCCLSAHSSPRTKEHFVKLTPSHKKYLGPSFLSGAWRYFMHGLLFFGRAYPGVSGQMDPNSMHSQTGQRIARSTSLPFPVSKKLPRPGEWNGSTERSRLLMVDFGIFQHYSQGLCHRLPSRFGTKSCCGKEAIPIRHQKWQVHEKIRIPRRPATHVIDVIRHGTWIQKNE